MLLGYLILNQRPFSVHIIPIYTKTKGKSAKKVNIAYIIWNSNRDLLNLTFPT